MGCHHVSGETRKTTVTKKIVIAGSGFAGMRAAVSAAPAAALAGREQDVEITIVSPSANLTHRAQIRESIARAGYPGQG